MVTCTVAAQLSLHLQGSEADQSAGALLVFPIANAFAQIVDEVNYGWRLDPYNHGLPPFDRCFTGIVDTLPVYPPTPHKWWMSALMFQPKYKACVMKFQLGISFAGDIILWTGPHLGIESDVGIWERTWSEHPFHSWERWLADLGYVGALGLVYKFKRVGRRRLTRTQTIFNNVHEHVRNRIENAVSAVKKHRIFKRGVCQLSWPNMRPFCVLVGHVTAYELRRNQRFDTYGPWQHGP